MPAFAIDCRLFQVTYREGVPVMAYLTLAHGADVKLVRNEEVGAGFRVDRDIEGKPFGIEIADRSMPRERMNELLEKIGQEPMDAREWAPLMLSQSP